MDFIILFKALILGIIEGITEFLPVSSTGHLIIAGDLLNFNDEIGKVFEIVIQLGAILAVCWEFRERLLTVAYGAVKKNPGAIRFIANLMVAFLPAAILGLLFIKFIKAHLFQPFTVAIAFILGALVILWVERRKVPVRIRHVDEMRWPDALKIGLAQTFSLIPGTSRAGATIMGGLYLGLSRQAATEFSFFLAIPTMFAATFYDLFKHWHLLHAQDFATFAVGFIAAFISAFFAVRQLLRYIAQHSFTVFAWYRIFFGIVLLVYYRAELFNAFA
ncbi:MAG: undecaprenyl-diphosphate phosphatase [Gammaproteobacteria bacterium]